MCTTPLPKATACCCSRRISATGKRPASCSPVIDVPINVTGFDNESAEIRSLLTAGFQVKVSSAAADRLADRRDSRSWPRCGAAKLWRCLGTALTAARPRRSRFSAARLLSHRRVCDGGDCWRAAHPFFNLREPGGHYRFFGFPARHPRKPARKSRNVYLRDCAAEFARDLESIVKRDPLQWYNFFPFWNAPPEPTASQATIGQNYEDNPEHADSPQSAPAAD